MKRRLVSASAAGVCLGLIILGTPAPALAAPDGTVEEQQVELEPVSDEVALPETIEDNPPAEEAQYAEAEVGSEVGVVAVVTTGDELPEDTFIRTTSTDGETSDWEEVEVADDEVPEESADATTVSSEPIIVTDVSSVEVVTSGEAATTTAAPTVQLQVYSSTVTAADVSASDLTWTNPAIRSREAWDADESLVKDDYVMGTVTGAMIHHTAGSNTYTEAQVPGILRSIQAYHVNGRGWNDIAYNVLVDRFGRAWQGRGGSVNQPIAGGHAYGITNRRVVGIALMGTFSSAPNAATQETLSQVIAWKLQMHRVNPYGSTWGSGGTDGGSTYLPAISGHRDEKATECPGQGVYNRMSAIRSRVKTLMDTVKYPMFWDVPIGATFEDEIRWLGAQGISNGYGDGAYRRSYAVERGQMATFLYRMAGSPAVTLPATSPFPDVPPSTSNYKAIIWLSQSGITQGYKDGTFHSLDKVTRGQMATFLYRFAKASPVSQDPGFRDVPPGSTNYDAIAWMAANDITQAVGRYNSLKLVSRGDMAAFLYRYDQAV